MGMRCFSTVFFLHILSFWNTGASRNMLQTHVHTHIQKTSCLTITDANTDLQIYLLIVNNSVIYFVHCLNKFMPYPATRNMGNISDWKSGTSIRLCNTTYMCYIATFCFMVSKYFMDSVSVSRRTYVTRILFCTMFIWLKHLSLSVMDNTLHLLGYTHV